MKVAALFVANPGCYVGLPDVDPWDVKRDARLYAGPYPVVAHPPCQLWVNFAALNYKRYGGEHNRPGNDGGCFASALASVRQWGGVLEHPASSKAWRKYGLRPPEPVLVGWWSDPTWPNAWTCEVWQSAYGHAARKRTWLLLRRPRKTAGARLDTNAWASAGRMVRSHQADALETGGVGNSGGIPGHAARPRATVEQARCRAGGGVVILRAPRMREPWSSRSS